MTQIPGAALFLLLIPAFTGHVDTADFNPRGSRPNVVVFMADDLGIGDLSSFGNTTLPTPNIDRLAKEGVKFTQLLAAASICTPSRAAFLTGRYPIRSGLSGVEGRPVTLMTPSTSALPPYEVTFAELAKEAGYKTAIIGKWHLGLHKNIVGDNLHSPLQQGFDYWYGIPLTNLHDFDKEERPLILTFYPYAVVIANSTVLACVFVLFFLYKKNFFSVWVFVILTIVTYVGILSPVWVYMNLKFLNSMLYRNTEIVEQPMQFTDLTKRLVDEGSSFLRDNYEQNGAPLLLYMSWIQVHTVLHAGPNFRGKSKHGRYGDEVLELDWSVGEILNTLDALGMKEDTLVFFTSDNGGMSWKRGKHGDIQGGYNGIYRGCKGQGSMDGGIRVPSYLSWPGRVAGGQTVDVPLSNMDLFPTIADVTGIPVPSDRVIDGRSLLPLVLGETQETAREHLFHYCTDKIHAVRFKPDKDGAVWKVRYNTPKWKAGTENCKYLCSCDERDNIMHVDRPLIFDMVAHPREDQSLASTDPRYKGLVEKAAQVVKEHKETIGEVECQMTFFKCIFRPHLMPCCNFPFCSCKDAKYFKQ